MPTPARTSTDAIIAAGRQAIADGGLEALTMQRVAETVGVRPPSLYKRLRNRSDLVRLVMEDMLRELTALLEGAASTGDAARDLRALAHGFRAYARSQPNAFGLLFSRVPPAFAPDPSLVARAAAPVLRTARALAGDEHALVAARTVTAWVTGFVRMELAGAFQLDGDVDEAFDYGVERIALALALS